MIKKLLSLPLRAAKVLLRFASGSKAPRSDGPLAYTPASGGLKRPTEAVRAPTPAYGDEGEDGHSHSHGHDHGHSHSHGEGEPEVAKPTPPAEAPPAAKKGGKKATAKGSEKGSERSAARPAEVDVYAEQTPNPNARKFTVVGKVVVEKGTLSFQTREEAKGNPLGEALYQVVGVRSIFAVKDFVTVTKEESADWAYLEPAVTNAIQSVF